VTNPEATTWFAQDFRGYIETYDYTVVMAYAAMEDKKDPRKWYRELFEATGGRENAARVVFKLQAYDWKGEKWVSDEAMKDDLTFLLSLGARHVAYYPDNVYQNKPDVDAVAVILSAREEVKRKQTPPETAPEGALERLFRRLFSRNP
jgi:biofilm PGA synthesis lipoprotein PgaB